LLPQKFSPSRKARPQQLAGASAAAVDLSPSNFDEIVMNSGKNAFVKFLAPW